jgi:hypothetical protein
MWKTKDQSFLICIDKRETLVFMSLIIYSERRTMSDLYFMLLSNKLMHVVGHRTVTFKRKK